MIKKIIAVLVLCLFPSISYATDIIKKDTTSKLLEVFISDSSSTTGGGLTGLVYNSAGLSCYYYRSGAGTATAITLATMTLGTWATGGFVVVDGTNAPGWYQIGLPNAMIATGASSVSLHCKGATNMVPLPIAIQLVSYDPDVAWSTLSATDNIGINWADISNPTTTQNLSGTSVLISDGTGAGQIDTLSGSIVNVDLADTCTAVTNGVTLTYNGTVTTGSCDPNTTLTFDTDMTQAGVNHWKDAFITFKDDTTTAELRGQTKVITASAVNGCLTVRGGFTTTPQSGDTFVVINK